MIFTLFMCCFLGLGAMQPQVAAPRSYENNITESKHKQNYAWNNTSYTFGAADLVSDTFIRNAITYFGTLQPSITDWGGILPENVTRSITYSFRPDSTRTHIFNLSTGAEDYSFDTSYMKSLTIVQTTLYQTSNAVNEFQFTFYMTYFYGSNNTAYDVRVFQYYAYVYQTRDKVANISINITTSWPQSLEGGSVLQVSESVLNDYHFFYDMIVTENNAGYTTGFNDGINAGYNQGYNEGFNVGTYRPNQETYNSIYNSGRQTGYAEGLAEAQDQTTLASQIFTGFVEVGLLPVNVFLQMFEYEVFGINIAGFVSALITIAMVIIIIRVVTGKKDG